MQTGQSDGDLVTLHQVLKAWQGESRAQAIETAVDQAVEGRGLPSVFKRALGLKPWIAAMISDLLVETCFPGMAMPGRIIVGLISGLTVELAAEAVGSISGPQGDVSETPNQDPLVLLRDKFFPDVDVAKVQLALTDAAQIIAQWERDKVDRVERQEGVLVRALTRHARS